LTTSRKWWTKKFQKILKKFAKTLDIYAHGAYNEDTVKVRPRIKQESGSGNRAEATKESGMLAGGNGENERQPWPNNYKQAGGETK
jgi:hypothetical protein